MLFNSVQFLIFFPLVVFSYYRLPYKYRQLLLLTASYVFYMSWNPVYGALLLISTSVDYFSALRIQGSSRSRTRRFYLVLSLSVNLGLLCYFKYLGFFTSLNNGVFTSVQNSDVTHGLLLPVGISFYTLQTIGYTIDVFRGHAKAETKFSTFALYVSFFPQLVAGPIERARNLIPQLREPADFDKKQVISGARLMGVGFLKKVVVADSLALYVDLVYGSPAEFTGLSLLLATFAFSFQIYCDFSGYSDIAIGAARVIGIKLSKNFDRPYFAKSISEYWQRWHISLNTWFRDFLYIPLGGSRTSVPRTYLNLLLVFIVSGFWHGANWTFLLWGFLHGLVVILEKIAKKTFSSTGKRHLPFVKLFDLMHQLKVFLVTSLLSIIFRSASLEEAWYIIQNIVTTLPDEIFNIQNWRDNFAIGGAPIRFVIALQLLVVIELAYYYCEKMDLESWFDSRPTIFKYAIYLVCFDLIYFLGIHTQRPFIYFQF